MELFNYGDIKEEHKQAVLEVMELARQQGNVVFAELLKHKFQIEEPVKVDHKDTDFAKACEAADVKLWIMGWVQDGLADAGSPHYPVVSITEDIRKIEKLVEAIRNQ
jgi:hypothetical protein